MISKKVILTSCLAVSFLISTGCGAGDGSAGMPEGCAGSGFSFSGKNLILNKGTGGVLNLYLIHNVSEDTVYMNHEVKNDPGAQAGWSTEIEPGNWTAFSVDKVSFGFTCGKMVPGKFDQVSCGDDLKACAFSNAEFSESAKGSYWVSENKSLEETLAAIKSRGITVSK